MSREGAIKAPQLAPLGRHPHCKRGALLCEGYWLTPTSLAEVHRACQLVESLHPAHRALATLDDISQAFYTKAYAILTHDLDSVEGHILTDLDDAAFEDGERIGYFSTKEEFPLRVANFKAYLEAQPLVCNRGVLLGVQS